MSEWYYIFGAYGLTYVVLAVYALRLRKLQRRALAVVHRDEGGVR
jgi:heme exporter protein D